MVLKDTDIGRLILDNLSTEKTAESKTCNVTSVEDAKKISGGLAKIASLPYKEEVYNSVQEIMKIASEVIGELAESFESSQNRTSELEKAAEVRSLIDEMVKIGSVDEYNVDEKVVELMKKSDHQLSITKEAMKLVKDGKEGNVFFDETEKNASVSSDTRKGMFDSVITD